ncbi:MAG: alpha/beta fold hydrolase [Tepidiformaceae bacterium]
MPVRPTESRVTANGVELAYFEWPGDGPTLLMSHATGFHARIWDQVIARLPGRHVISVDLRGHGRSSRPAPPYSWRTFGEDLGEFVRVLGLRNLIGVGHSMGGHSVAFAAALQQDAFDALVLIDPTFSEEAFYGNRPGSMDHIRRRRNEWRSPQEMFERFQGRAPFASWDEKTLRDYCDYGLLRSESGDGFELACLPDIEAAIYEGNVTGNVYPEVSRLTIPVRALLARERVPGSAGGNFDGSVTHADFFRHVPQAESFRFSAHSHFLPMEAPTIVAAHVDEVARAISA